MSHIIPKKNTPMYFQTKLVYKKSKNMVNQVHGHLRALQKNKKQFRTLPIMYQLCHQ